MHSRKPQNKAYPIALKTLGDHLRKARLDRGLSQPGAARILKVLDDTLTGWKLNKNQPTAKYARVLIEFLGYVPTVRKDQTLAKKLFLARQIVAQTQKQAAKKMGCDASNLRYIELGERSPNAGVKKKIKAYIHYAQAIVKVQSE